MQGGDLQSALRHNARSGSHEFDWCAASVSEAVFKRRCWTWACIISYSSYFADVLLPRHNKGKEVALAVARGLCFMHKNGVIHRQATFIDSAARPSTACLTTPAEHSKRARAAARAVRRVSLHAELEMFWHPEASSGRCQCNCHDRTVILRRRRDVKPSNILLTEDGHAKVSDMGLSRADFFSSSTAFAGTFMYAAPEVLLGRPSNDKARAMRTRACQMQARLGNCACDQQMPVGFS